MRVRNAGVPHRRAWASYRQVVLGFLVWLSLAGQPESPTAAAATSPQDSTWKAGVAAVAITPPQPMWMAGYAARTKPSEGKVHDLHAKALALADADGTQLVIVTLDLIGIDRQMRKWVVSEVNRRFGLGAESLLINASHTHCGPVLRQTRYSIYGDSLYGLTPEQIEQCRKYSEHLQHQIANLVGEALDALTPAQVTYTHARAGFAMNRRLRTEHGWRISPNPDGPVDHDVPVLRVSGTDGKLRAVLFGYACHGTTLSFYQFCGDYAGFAQEYLEQAHPGTTALFVAGCGGDQNPYPRGKERALELCRQHGRALANAVEAALQGPPKPVEGPLRMALREITLEFAEPPTRDTLQEQAKSNNRYERQHAEFLLAELDRNGAIQTTYPYPIQVVQFGGDLTLVALAGEVVVDYALRLKQELAGPVVWVAGYCNDVFGYVPSVRVLTEGGYEGGGAMRYTPLPGPFAPSVEQRIVKTVHELAHQVRTGK